MSGKRSAEEQMDHLNYHLFEQNDDDEPIAQVKASDEVLAKRKILKPRSRLAGRTSANIPKPAASSFGFNFQPIASATTSGSDALEKPNPFASFGSSNNNSEQDKPKPNPFAAFAPAKPTSNASKDVSSKPNFSFGQTSTTIVSKNTESSLSSNKSDKANKIKALNDNFYNKITQERSKDPLSDFTPILLKYIEYYEPLNNDSSNNNDEPLKQIEQKPEEPQFKALPAADFNFGTATKPSFSFDRNGTAKTTASTASSFNFGVKASKPDITIQAKPVEKEASPDVIEVDDKDDDESSDDEVKVEGPKFTLDKPPTTTDSVFKLTKDTTTSSATTSAGPSFTFTGGDKKFDNPFKFTKPIFEEEPKKDEEEKEKEQPKPAFSFSLPQDNKKDTSTTPPTSGFSLSAPLQPPSNNTTEAPKAAFSFNLNSVPSQPSNDEVATKPAFSFGSNGSSSTTASVDSDNKPKFDFNFGTTSKPAFGSSAESTTTTTTSAPAFHFAGSTSTTPTFGGASNFSFNFSKPATATTTSDSGNQDEDKADEEEPKVQFTAVAKLQEEKVEEKTGEEDEELLYTKRSKIQRFNKESKGYDSKGLGDLKVLVNKSTKKARILVRADGSNRVILNVPILADFKYEKMGGKGNIIKIPVVEEGKIETYLSQVKTGEDGTNLFNALEKAKQEL